MKIRFNRFSDIIRVIYHLNKKMRLKQDHLNKIGEEEIQNEDRWIADVFDTYDYDEEDMQR